MSQIIDNKDGDCVRLGNQWRKQPWFIYWSLWFLKCPCYAIFKVAIIVYESPKTYI